jgi:hypothetical protein
MELDESFCDTEEERELSRMTIEVAKERIGNFEPYLYLRDGPGPVYAMLHKQIQGAMAGGLQAVLHGARPA